MGNEGGLDGVPAEGADAELQHGEALGGVAELEVPDVGAVELEGVPPRGAGDAAHLQVDPHERGVAHPRPQLLQRLRQVPPRHLLHRHPGDVAVPGFIPAAAGGRWGGGGDEAGEEAGEEGFGRRRAEEGGEAAAALHGHRRWSGEAAVGWHLGSIWLPCQKMAENAVNVRVEWPVCEFVIERA